MTVARAGRPDPLQVALEVAREAGAVLLDHLREPLDITEKGRRADIVTAADRASERVVIDRLRVAFPDATILGEESGVHRGSSDERWIVDPLDGTTNYAHGYPLFCISIAYERAGELIAGVIHAPLMHETFAAERGAGATFNERRIAVSKIASVSDAMICTGFRPADFERNAEYFRAMSGRAQAVRRDGSAALDLAYVAAGRFDGFWEWDLGAWDVAAGTLIVREAGGVVTRIDGSPASVEAESILASNGRIHEELRAILSLPR
ncbi:MAG: inositol monophosphatase family protein [Vulcanimicrobiaceae bacterium]